MGAADFDPENEQPLDEFGYEKLMRESDARTDKYIELLKKYEGHPDQEKLSRAKWDGRGWRRRLKPMNAAPFRHEKRFRSLRSNRIQLPKVLIGLVTKTVTFVIR